MDLPNTEYDQFGCHTPIFNQLAIYAMVIQVATRGNSHIKLYFWVDDHSFILKQREFNHGISYRYINVLWCYNSYIYIYTYIAYHLHWLCFLPPTKNIYQRKLKNRDFKLRQLRRRQAAMLAKPKANIDAVWSTVHDDIMVQDAVWTDILKLKIQMGIGNSDFDVIFCHILVFLP